MTIHFIFIGFCQSQKGFDILWLTMTILVWEAHKNPWTMLELDNGLILVKDGRQILMINEMCIEYDEYK